MARIIDITDKLTFDAKPAIMIAGKKIEINDDAVTVLKLMGKMGDGEKDVTPGLLAELSDMLFTQEGKAIIERMNLNFHDFSILVETAMNLITGGADEDPKPEGSTITISSTTGT